MRVSSHSSQAVDILCSGATTAFTVRLRRRVKLSALTKSRSKLSSMALDTGSRLQDILVARAVWWPSTTAADLTLVSGRYIRYIRGELRLKDELKPSSVMPYMRIEVRFHPTNAEIALPRSARLMYIILLFQYSTPWSYVLSRR